MGDPEYPRELVVAQPAVELQRDDLPVARRQRGEGAANGRPAERDVSVVLGHPLLRAYGVDWVDGQRRLAAPTAQLVERRVAGDPEQPRAFLAAPAIKRPPAAVRALERERRHIL